MYTIQGGANIVYTNFYNELLTLEPYIAFDFLQYKFQLTYVYRTNNISPGWGGAQASFIYCLGRSKEITAGDRTTYLPRKRR
jgi:hypothetical protein